MRHVDVATPLIHDARRSDDIRSDAKRYWAAAAGILGAIAEGLASAQRYDALAGDTEMDGSERANLARIAVLGRSG